MNKDVIIACDFPGAAQTYAFLDLFTEEKPFVKIGMELFYSAGPEIVREIKRRGHKIFLDLKLHDIPNTVGRSMAVLSGLDVDICNLHAAGGSEMMRAAVKGLTREDGSRPLLIAVTMLTSIDEERMNGELGIQGSLPDTVMKYALCARDSGLDGLSARRLRLRRCTRPAASFLTVTPGIRFSGGAEGDQKRVTTPARAREIGSDYIVVGRPITAAADPVEAYRRCVRDLPRCRWRR